MILYNSGVIDVKLLVFRLLLLCAIASLSGLQSASAAEVSRSFPETGYQVGGVFLAFFDSHGGLDIFGYPRTTETSQDGHMVQYFQRARLEWWPENPAPYQVQLGLLGQELGKGEPRVDAAAAGADGRYFPETGHTLRGAFRDFWEQRGGLDIFGYPISEEHQEGGLTVQYFQRARMEWHPDNPANYRVQLGLLGDELLSRQAIAGGGFGATAKPASAIQGTAEKVLSGGAGKIVFQEAIGGGIYTMNADGSNVQRIGQGMDPALSPDGTRVAYAQWDNPAGIYVMNADGSGATQVLAVEKPQGPMWSPDGTKILFYSKYIGTKWGFNPATRRPGWIPDDQWKLTVLDVDTGQVQDLPCMLYSQSPSWSPDGQTVVYKGDRGLYITAANATSQQLISGTDTRFVSPVWSPTGDRIAFMWRQHDHWEIGVINPDGSGFQLLTNFAPFTHAANNVAPAWSPDGKEIAFLSDREGPWRIYVMCADGSNQRKLSDADVNYNYAFERMLSWVK